MVYGIQLVHQDPRYAKFDKKEPLWLTERTPMPVADRTPDIDWIASPRQARRFATPAEAAAARPDPWLVATKVVVLP